jgi:hypothetical protein
LALILRLSLIARRVRCLRYVIKKVDLALYFNNARDGLREDSRRAARGLRNRFHFFRT